MVILHEKNVKITATTRLLLHSQNNIAPGMFTGK